MERVRGVELFDYLAQHGALPVEMARSVLHQLLEALAALDALGVVHRDVKPENLVISGLADEGDGEGGGGGNDGGSPHLTLIDFGYAALLTNTSDGLMTGVAGSPEYAAPEVLSWLEAEADPTGALQGIPYDASCDVWSAGVTAHVLLSAELPIEMPADVGREGSAEFAAQLIAATRELRSSFQGAVWATDALQPARDFISCCLKEELHERLTAEELLCHPWMRTAPQPPHPSAPQLPQPMTPPWLRSSQRSMHLMQRW
jgi:serine/threonine protein kinase